MQILKSTGCPCDVYTNMKIYNYFGKPSLQTVAASHLKAILEAIKLTCWMSLQLQPVNASMSLNCTLDENDNFKMQ